MLFCEIITYDKNVKGAAITFVKINYHKNKSEKNIKIEQEEVKKRLFPIS